MKLQHAIGLWLCAVLLLAGCAGHDAVPDVEELRPSLFNAEGKAYLVLQFDLSNTTQTRSDNGTFEDGTAAENAVKNAAVLLFKGAGTEATRTLCGAYSVGTDFSLAQTSQTYSHKTVTIELNRANISEADLDNLYALVVLNSSGLIGTIDASTHTATVGGAATPTFETVSRTVMTSIGDDSQGYLMSNAPVSNKPGGTIDPTGAAITTLVKINPDAIFPTEAEANSKLAATINVERAAAKVSVKNALATKTYGGNTYYYISGAGAEHQHHYFTSADIKVAIDFYNTGCFLTRQTASTWTTMTTPPGSTSAYNGASSYYRFVETQPIIVTQQQYRTYWGEDINYGDATGLSAFTGASEEKKDLDATFYVAENTINEANMLRDRSTAIVVLLKLNGGQDFYTIPGHRNDIYRKNEVSENGTSASEAWSRRYGPTVFDDGALSIDYALIDWLFSDDNPHKARLRSWYTFYHLDPDDENQQHYLNITLTKVTDVNGRAEVTDVQQTAFASGTAAYTAFNTTVVYGGKTLSQLLTEELNTAFDWHDDSKVIYYYKGGLCYYRIPVQHFGDELTPWTSGSYTSAGHLGRYGVVRNHHYTVNINSAMNIGKSDYLYTIYKDFFQTPITLSDDENE